MGFAGLPAILRQAQDVWLPGAREVSTVFSAKHGARLVRSHAPIFPRNLLVTFATG
jgi:hypothetical protein